MPVSQGLHGGYMPGMTLRAWALVDSAGNLVKGNGISAAIRVATGSYKVTLSGAAPSATTIVKGTPRNATPAMICWASIAGQDISYLTKCIDSAAGANVDSAHLLEVYE